MFTPAQVAQRLGLKKAARSWRGTCPACGYRATLIVRAGRDGRALMHCANCADQDGLAAIISDAMGEPAWRPKHQAPGVSATNRVNKQAAALRLWEAAVPVPGTPAQRYLETRRVGHLAPSPELRFLASCPHPEVGRLPAMLAAVREPAGTTTAIHRTYIRADGSGKADVEPAKATLGPIWAGAIRLAAWEPNKPLIVGEGLETAASAGQMLGGPAWAAIAANNLGAGLILPPEVKNIIIAADPDPPGEKAAREAAIRWSREGRQVRIARPNGAGDFNDLAMKASRHAD